MLQVTGGSSGIGKSVAIQAAKRGAHVTIIARDPNKLQSARDEIIRACQTPTQRIKAISSMLLRKMYLIITKIMILIFKVDYYYYYY